MRLLIPGLAILLLAPSAPGATPDLELVMSDPDWIGNPPENPYWADSGAAVYYEQKRVGGSIRDLQRIELGGGGVKSVSALEATASSNTTRVYNRERSKVAWLHRGDVMVLDLASGRQSRVTGTVEEASDLQFMADGESVSWLQTGQHWIHHLGSGLTRQASDIRYRNDPDVDHKFSALRDQQRRTYATLREGKRRQTAARKHAQSRQREDTGRPPLPVYLGETWQELDRSLSPSGQHLLLVLRERDKKEIPEEVFGRPGSMPNYVTLDGYTEVQEVRRRVGREPPAAQVLLLVDLASASYRRIDYSKLAGIGSDPPMPTRRRRSRISTTWASRV